MNMDRGAEDWQQLCSDQYADLRRHLDACYRRQRIRRAVTGGFSTVGRGLRAVAKAFIKGLISVGACRTGAAHLRR
jgi:hypothetical protein